MSDEFVGTGATVVTNVNGMMRPSTSAGIGVAD